MYKRNIGIIGVTGSIGTQAQDVICLNKDQFNVVFVTAHRDAQGLEQAAVRLGAGRSLLTGTAGGIDALMDMIDETGPDIVLVAAAGMDIIPVVYHLSTKAITIALANKECLVSAGKLIMQSALENGSKILPVDSEHSAIFQCLEGQRKCDATRLTLTASGGAFRDYSANLLHSVTVEQALKHPNWSMGKKITIDSATMMNKGLELIEAHVLFDMPSEKLDVVIHPQSIVHSMVSFIDGSVLAQMGHPDMRTPIAYALGYPERLFSGAPTLDFTGKITELIFYPPELEKYPCLRLALDILKQDSQTRMIAMNAANELAVEAFIEGRIGFMDIARVVEEAADRADYPEPPSVDVVMEIDREVRRITAGRL